jgi:REP element-mobilizing transposase RayT
LRYDNFIAPPRFVQIRSRGRLPHWEVDRAIYFVTFSLEDALPAHVAVDLYREREKLMRFTSTSNERARLDRALELRFDQHFDDGRGSCLLREHAQIVAGALKHFDQDRYWLHGWCVMPNHVHVLFYLERGCDLPLILHSWKSYTAHKIKRGQIWQREYFDRVIRTPQEYTDTLAYIRANPAKAGLVNWAWVG